MTTVKEAENIVQNVPQIMIDAFFTADIIVSADVDVHGQRL